MRRLAVLALAFLLGACSSREVSLDGHYQYRSGDNVQAGLTIKGHNYLLCAPECKAGGWDYESQADHTRLVFNGAMADFLQHSDPFFHKEHNTAEIGNVEYGYGCPCLNFSEPDGPFFQMDGTTVQEKIAALWKKKN